MSRRRRTGSNAVEFALTVPVLIVILSGIVDFSWYFHLQYNLINAVAQGARAGSATDPVADPGPEEVAEDVATRAYDESDTAGAPTFAAAFSGAAPNRVIVVTGEMTYEDLQLVGFLPDSIIPNDVAHSATMRMQDQDEPPAPAP